MKNTIKGKFNKVVLFVVILICSLLLPACVKSHSYDQKEIVVFAAASLTESFLEIEKQYEAEHPEIDIVFNFAGSQMLTSQIKAGGRPSCFFSANTKYPLELIEDLTIIDGLVLEEKDMTVFATNELIIITNVLLDSQEMTFIENLNLLMSEEGLKIVIANESVPVGKYTHNFLDTLKGSKEDVMVSLFYDHIISYENDVKSVVAKVNMKEADLGVVYKTDLVNLELETIEIPLEYNQVATYGSLILSKDEDVKDFYTYVLSGNGRDILDTYNFGR